MAINNFANIFLLIILGVLPCVLWLLLYLREDVHPEPNRMILKVFFWGMVSAVAAYLLEYIIILIQVPALLADLGQFYQNLTARPDLLFTNLVVFAPVVEEIVKLLVIFFLVLKNPVFDEPIDAMLYMIIAALGFAALENIFALAQSPDTLFYTFAIRSFSAILLHTISSAILGYFLALAFTKKSNRAIIIFPGIIIAVIIHSIYNYLIGLTFGFTGANAMVSPVGIAMLVVYLAGSGLLVFSLMNYLKKSLGICKINNN